ncbi:DctP family TRAP transporter solute-binding subunit [Pseudogracilibacillus sp. SE30717A]|uniref:DctP family TRAP transporter solute-binding subunit n=1 Tax=Pseudogracilibacillus sp. SE30717A TaxID=3098293 RepID=UPI00300E17DD
MKLRMFISIVMVVSLLVGCSSGTTNNESETKDTDNQETIKIRFSHVSTPTSLKGVATEKFAELVEEKTDGAVKVEVYPSSQLYGDNDELDALIAGNVEMINPSVSKLVKLDKRWQYTDMPFLFQSTEHVYDFFDSDLGKVLLESDRLIDNGIIGLTFWANGFKNFSNDKQEISSPEDFKGMKFRTQAGNVIESQFRALGAGATTIPWGETYSALQQGVADGAEVTADLMSSANFHEVQEHLTISEHGRLDLAVLVNKEFWEGLPDDIRDQINEALEEATEYERQLALEFNDKSIQELKDGGMKVKELSSEEKEKLEQALQPVYDEFREEITPELIDGIKGLAQ